jgi:glycosyltransferase involved in cell wall biosynthesis
VIFVGAMDWEPNVDAMEYFCAEIWPLVLGQMPEAKLRIVGRNPVDRVRRLASDSVEVTGRVPDVREHLREAAVVVVPLRVGGGTRLKIYEAMAAGRAVISTAVGAEGLDVHHGRDIVLANSPRSFADAVLTLLRDENLRNKYEGAARELARKYDWSGIALKFAQVLERVAASSPAIENRGRSETEMQENVGGGTDAACKH